MRGILTTILKTQRCLLKPKRLRPRIPHIRLHQPRMNTQTNQPLILHAHLHNQNVRQRLTRRITRIRIWILGHVVQTPARCADENEPRWSRSGAEERKCGFVEKHDGDCIYLQHFHVLLKRHVFDGIQFRDPGGGDHNVNSLYPFRFQLFDCGVRIGCRGAVNLGEDDFRVVAPGDVEERLGTGDGADGGDDGIIWLGDIVFEHAATDTWKY
jgi:hypothetical protein